MKKLIAMLLIVALVCCMFTMTALARDPIISPEQGNTDIDTVPQSPQTGGLNIAVYIAAAIVLCGIAVISIRKIAAA